MKTKIQLLALMVTAALVSGCNSENKGAESTVEVVEVPKVELARVTTRPVAQTEEYTGTVEADVKNNITSNSNLRIEKINVEVGDRVSKGQTLVHLDASNLEQLKLQLANLKIEFERVDQLYKVGGASKSEWDAAKMQLDVNQTQYNNLIVNTMLVSPISGVITARNYDNGDMPGSNPILVVEQITPVKLMINISEGYYPKVSKGMPIKVLFDTYGDEEFMGTVNLVYPTIDANTRTFTVEVRLANGDQRVRPGMFARATVNFGTADHTVVPDRAIVKQTGSGDRFVYVYENGKVSYNKVELGRRVEGEYEILSGVPADCQVVVAGQRRLSDGAQVEVIK